MVSTSPRSRSSARIGSANGTGAWKYFPNEYTSRLPSGDAIGRTILAGSVGSTSTRFRSPVNDTSMRLDPDAEPLPPSASVATNIDFRPCRQLMDGITFLGPNITLSSSERRSTSFSSKLSVPGSVELPASSSAMAAATYASDVESDDQATCPATGPTPPRPALQSAMRSSAWNPPSTIFPRRSCPSSKRNAWRPSGEKPRYTNRPKVSVVPVATSIRNSDSPPQPRFSPGTRTSDGETHYHAMSRGHELHSAKRQD